MIPVPVLSLFYLNNIPSLIRNLWPDARRLSALLYLGTSCLLYFRWPRLYQQDALVLIFLSGILRLMAYSNSEQLFEISLPGLTLRFDWFVTLALLLGIAFNYKVLSVLISRISGSGKFPIEETLKKIRVVI